MASTSNSIDNYLDLYSRQIGTIGKNTMSQLSKLKVLIAGLDTIGSECMKCLALLGVGKIYIYDKTIITKKHKRRIINYESFEGTKKSLGHCAFTLCKELNPIIPVELFNNLGMNDLVNIRDNDGLDCIILTDERLISIEIIQEFCSKNNIKFILGINNSLFGYIFCNFNKHTIYDVDGENIETTMMHNYSIDVNSITINYDKLDRNIMTKYVELENENRNRILVKVITSSLENIQLEKTDNLLEFLGNSTNIIINEKKDTVEIEHRRFNEVTNEFNYQLVNINSSFQTNNNLYTNYIDYIRNPKKIPQLFEKYFMDSKFYILGCLIGGILANEVIKITGKYTPLSQELLFDYSDLYGKEFFKTSQVEYDILSNFDRELITSMRNKYIFMVGCGALGCELSKNLGMMGFCKTKNSLLTITDMDTIELSNLNRQFLFRREDIGKYKSEVIKERLGEYIPNFNVRNFRSELSKNTENLFNDLFWDSQDIIINALDNIDARKYVDNKCVIHNKPLFESGTLGSKGNVQTIIPYKTATYSEITDIIDKTIPMCTIRNFPNKIEHCVEWSLELFSELFNESINNYRSLMQNPKKYLEEIELLGNDTVIKNTMENILVIGRLFNIKDYRDFVTWCIFIYDKYFRNPVRDLLYSYPEDIKDEQGNLFWIGNRIKPRDIGFNKIDSIDFIEIFTNFIVNKIPEMKKHIFRYKQQLSDDEIYVLIKNDYKPKIVKASIKDDTSQIIENDINELIENLKHQLLSLEKSDVDFDTIVYDKDDNILLEMMNLFVNIRANFYNIKQIDSLDTKLLSGRIIPALTTTTTIVSALVIIELMKHLYHKKPSDININIGINQYLIFDCMIPRDVYNDMYSDVYGMRIKTIPECFNTWTKIKIQGKQDDCLNMESLINILEGDYGINPMMILVNNNIIYSGVIEEDSELFTVFTNIGVNPFEYIELTVISYDQSGIPIITPKILYKYV